MVESLTVAQAVVRYLVAEGVEFVLGILGRGNLALGEAIREARGKIRFIPVKNQQAAVHLATAYARMTGRPLAVTTSIGPGATNMVTGAAVARVARIPVLLLPGEIPTELVGPALQQVENLHDASANDTLRPVSRSFSRVARAEQLFGKMREAFDAMLTPGDMGPATVCLPTDVQEQTYPFVTDELVRPGDRDITRTVAEPSKIAEAAAWIAAAKRPLIVAGGGLFYARAWDVLTEFAEMASIPVATTHSGTGALLDDHPLAVGPIGPTGGRAANRLARRTDLVIGIGTRYAGLVLSHGTGFSPEARIININVSHHDVRKIGALRLWGEARLTLTALVEELRRSSYASHGSGSGASYRAHTPWFREIVRERAAWHRERDQWLNAERMPMSQGRVIGVVNEFLARQGTVVTAAGSLPGDLQRLWKPMDADRQGYYAESGCATLGFEIPAAIGVKLALPARHAVAMVGDMGFLMSASEIATAAQMRVPITVVVCDNGGGQSVQRMQRAEGRGTFGMEYRIDGGEDRLALDFVKVAEGYGAIGIAAATPAELERALEKARSVQDRPVVIHVPVDAQPAIGEVEPWGPAQARGPDKAQ